MLYSIKHFQLIPQKNIIVAALLQFLIMLWCWLSLWYLNNICFCMVTLLKYYNVTSQWNIRSSDWGTDEYCRKIFSHYWYPNSEKKVLLRSWKFKAQWLTSHSRFAVSFGSYHPRCHFHLVGPIYHLGVPSGYSYIIERYILYVYMVVYYGTSQIRAGFAYSLCTENLLI